MGQSTFMRAFIGIALYSFICVGDATPDEKTDPLILHVDGIAGFWLVRLCMNVLGYASIFVPGYFLIRHLRKVRYNETGTGPCSTFLKMCAFGKDAEKHSLESGPAATNSSDDDQSFNNKLWTLILCVAGLQGSYLTWGVLQERVMTYKYGETETTSGEMFTNSQFLVLINRILAFSLAVGILHFRPPPSHNAPLYKYSYSSFSNIMSSWCQYEALKFVSFPTQVLAKACKIIPVMLMGKVVSKKTYNYHEYVTAAMISVGVSMFLLTSGDVTRHKDTVTTFSGVILLVGYMCFDSFTSNWQGELFSQYKMSSIQMMAGVNMFSCLLTFVSLIEQGTLLESLSFMGRNLLFMFHALLLSLCSASGQLFIFFTISRFGAVTFTIIMTVRQGLAIFLSCMIYGHPVPLVGILGIVIVFAALFLRIYANQRKKALQKAKAVITQDISKV